MKFNDETKAVKEFGGGNWFDFGVHKVQMILFENGGLEDGQSEYVEVSVGDPEDGEKTDTVRLYFTEKAANYSFNTFRQIAVHNAGSDKGKDAARDAIDAVQDTTELVELLNDKLIGKECWFTKYYDPKRTYESQSGEVKKSVNKNIYGYEPKLKPELMPDQAGVADSDKVTDAFPDSEKVKGDAAGNIPKGWA